MLFEEFGVDTGEKVERFIEHGFVQNFLILLIILNAIILGLETNHEVMAAVGKELFIMDEIILWIFIAEISLLIYARRLHFFKECPATKHHSLSAAALKQHQSALRHLSLTLTTPGVRRTKKWRKAR